MTPWLGDNVAVRELQRTCGQCDTGREGERGPQPPFQLQNREKKEGEWGGGGGGWGKGRERKEGEEVRAGKTQKTPQEGGESTGQRQSQQGPARVCAERRRTTLQS